MRPVLCVCVWAQQLSPSAQPCPWLPELPRRPRRDNVSFYFPDFLQPAETGAGLCSAPKSEDLEVVSGNPGRRVSWLAHTAWTGADLFHSEFPPSGALPTGMNSDLQLTGTGGESSNTASQPFAPYIPLLHHLLPDFWWEKGRGRWLLAHCRYIFIFGI